MIGPAWSLLGTLAESEAFEFGTPGFGTFEFEKPGVERREPTFLEAEMTGFVRLLLGTLAQFAKAESEAFEFVKREAAMRRFGKREAARCERLCLESRTWEAATIGLAWLLFEILGTLAKSVESEASEFGKRESGRPGAERRELICLGSVTRGAGKTGFAWSLLGTLVKFENAEFEELEFGKRGAAKRE